MTRSSLSFGLLRRNAETADRQIVDREMADSRPPDDEMTDRQIADGEKSDRRRADRESADGDGAHGGRAVPAPRGYRFLRRAAHDARAFAGQT